MYYELPTFYDPVHVNYLSYTMFQEIYDETIKMDIQRASDFDIAYSETGCNKEKWTTRSFSADQIVPLLVITLGEQRTFFLLARVKGGIFFEFICLAIYDINFLTHRYN